MKHSQNHRVKGPTAWDEKAAANPRYPKFSLVPRPPTPTRSTFASICIVATCTSAQLMSTGLGSTYAISVPSAGKDLHIKKEDLQWILNAYSISSVNKFKHVQQHRYGSTHFGPAYRHVSFFPVGDWQTCMVAGECGLLDTRFWSCLVSDLASLNVCYVQSRQLWSRISRVSTTAQIALDTLRGLQGIGSAAIGPASVRIFTVVCSHPLTFGGLPTS
jgi:hypothetical protein